MLHNDLYHIVFLAEDNVWVTMIDGVNLLIPNTGKYVPEKTPYLDTFHAVIHDKSHFSSHHLTCKTRTWDCLSHLQLLRSL